MCPSKYPITADWQDYFKEGEESQEDNLSVCSEWDADLEEQDWKHLEMTEQKQP